MPISSNLINFMSITAKNRPTLFPEQVTSPNTTDLQRANISLRLQEEQDTAHSCPVSDTRWIRFFMSLFPLNVSRLIWFNPLSESFELLPGKSSRFASILKLRRLYFSMWVGGSTACIVLFGYCVCYELVIHQTFPFRENRPGTGVFSINWASRKCLNLNWGCKIVYWRRLQEGQCLRKRKRRPES